MTDLALRTLWQQKLRFALSILSVALAMTLILLLNGFLAGVYRQVTAYLDRMQVDYVVAEEGTNNLLGASSILPGGAEARARGVSGVAQVIPIIAQYVILDIHDKKVVGYMVGYDPEKGGGPWAMRAGRVPAADDEVVLDWIMAEQHGFTLGDTIEILARDFTVVGLSEDTNSWMASFFFVTKRAAEKLLSAPDMTGYLFLSLQPDAEPGAIDERLHRRLRKMEVLPAATVRQNDLDLIVEVFAIPLQMMVGIAFAVGTAILSMVIYSATAERMREYGVLKAIGATNRYLYGLVTIQAIVVAVLGILLGMGMAWITAQWIMTSWPQFEIVFQFRTLITVAISGILMGVLAAWMPALQVGRLDPAAALGR